MEVSHISDYDTHAIMGGGKAKKFGIVQNAEFITVLSSTLYSDGPLALVREVTCNAWDAHKITNQTDIPVVITLDHTKLSIRDFGPGIDPALMEDIYCTYGASTKKAQENQTGGFGLGSKSPFAYTTHFTVTVHFKGKKTVWAISRGSVDTDGMPEAIPIITVPTTETGVLVEVPLETSQDYEKFENLVKGIVKFGGINAALNGKQLPTIPLDKTKEGILFTMQKPLTVNGVLYVRYGNVVYPIPSHREYDAMYDAASKIVKKSTSNWKNGFEYHDMESLVAIFEAEPNTISVTPSRESLHTSDRTIKTVKELLTKFLTLTQNSGGSDLIMSEEQKIMDWWFAKKKDSRELLTIKNLIQVYYEHKEHRRFVVRSVDKLSVDEFILTLAANGHFYNEQGIGMKAKQARLARIIKDESIDNDLLVKLGDMLKKQPILWDTYYASRPNLVRFTNILSRGAAAGLNPKNFILWDREGYAGRKAYSGKELYVAQDTLENLIMISRRVIMLVEAKGQIMSHRYTDMDQEFQHIHKTGCMVYLWAQRNHKKKHPSLEETKQFLIKQGYVVIDVASYFRKKTAERLAQEQERLTLPDAVVEPEVRKPRNQYLSMQNLYSHNTPKGSTDLFVDTSFTARNYLERPDGKQIWLAKPEYVFQAAKIASYRSHDSKFFSFRDDAMGEILKLFGSQGAIAVSIKQKEKMIKEGAVDGEDWLVDKITTEIMSNKIFIEVIAYDDFFNEMQNISHSKYNRLKDLPSVNAALPMVPVLSKENKHYKRIFEHMGNYKRFLTKDNMHKMEVAEKYLETASKTAITNPFSGLFPDDLDERLNSINFTNVMNVLDDPTASTRDRVFNETILSMALFG